MTEQLPIVACLVRQGSAYVVSSKDLDQALRTYRRKWAEPFLPVAALEIGTDSFRHISGIAISSTRPASVTVAEAARVFGRLGVATSARRAFVFHLANWPAPALMLEWARSVKAAQRT